MGVHLVTPLAKSSTCTPDIQRFKKLAWFVGGTKQTKKMGMWQGVYPKIDPQNVHENLRCALLLLNYYPKGRIWWRFVAPPNQNSSILSPIFLCLNSMYCCRGFFGELKWWWSGGCTIPLKNVLIKLGLLEKMKIQNMWKWETTYANKWMILRFEHLVWK